MKNTAGPLIARYDSQPDCVEATVNVLRASLHAALAARETAVLAVPGGRTMEIILPALAATEFPWDRIVVTLVDERWVPGNHSDSNETFVRRMLQDIAHRVSFRGLYLERAALREAARTLSQTIPAPDTILLAMGDDGHIASLFAGDAALGSSTRYAAVEREDHARISMTPRALTEAETIVLPILGAKKEVVLQRALDGDELPVCCVLRAGTQIFIGP